MADDEIPTCVAGTAPGVRPERVAGESVNAPFGTENFRLASRAGEPTDCRDYDDTNAGAFYSVNTCGVPRYEGIEKFDDRGEVDGYVRYYDVLDDSGGRGPRGPCAPEVGVWDAPPGPTGRQFCPGCCKSCPRRCQQCTTNTLGVTTCICIDCSYVGACGAPCSPSQC